MGSRFFGGPTMLTAMTEEDWTIVLRVFAARRMAGSTLPFPEKYVGGLSVGRNATPSTGVGGLFYPARLILGYCAGLSVELTVARGPRSYYCWM